MLSLTRSHADRDMLKLFQFNLWYHQDVAIREAGWDPVDVANATFFQNGSDSREQIFHDLMLSRKEDLSVNPYLELP